MRRYRVGFVGAFAAVLFTAVACSDSGTGTTPGGGTPTRVDVVTAPAAVGAAGALAGAFTVKVVDSKGAGVPNIAVTFASTGAVVASPGSVTTDASGTATTQVALSTIAGSGTVRATVTGVSTAATTVVTVIAGATTKIVNNPKTLRFFNVGDTARIASVAQDQFGNTATAGAVSYSVLDGTLVSVDQTGLVRVLRQPGTTLVIASSSSRADTTTVTVLAAGASNCTGLVTATPMNVGDVQTFTGAQYACLNGATAGAEFALVAFNSSADPSALPTSVLGNGLSAPPSAIKLASTGTAALRSAIGTKTSSLPLLDEDFHLRLLSEANREFKGALPRARMARRAAVSRSISGNGTVSYSAIPASAKVGDIITLNVSSGICSGAVNHGLRVEAIGTKSIILGDTLNPTGGFANSDYQRIAARFDTLVYPLDVDAFGTPSDLDNNGRVAILFTRSVNEMVDSTSGYFVGGFFNPRDLFPKVGATPSDNCAGSNEGEMFYMLVPAPNGINGVKHTIGFVDSLTTGIVAHEFQHLINGSRRFYINTAATDFEEPWLNEGLSHIAEELLYYRESGLTPRLNLTDQKIRLDNRLIYPLWKNDASSNFARLIQYLRNPGGNSPYADDDELATRGATWQFLRYLADRLGPADGNFWQRFDNSTVTGLATLQQVVGAPTAPYFRDWAVANYVDDLGINSDPRFMHASWNFRDIFTNTYVGSPPYPLAVSSLADGTKQDLSVRGGSASYLRFSLPAGKEGLLTFSSGGGLPSTPFQFVVVRTK
ncbi:MAG: Ig-like domain-containing protein [Gemmatimonadaceae bacterium]